MSIDASPAMTGTIFAFLFTDIEGSTRRWESYKVAMQGALARHDALMRAAMAAHGGHVFKTIGDAFCVAFPAAPSAVAAALAVQTALAKEDFSAVEGIRVRIGIHVGPAASHAQDYFGPTLNRVARLMSVAHGGQIVLSAAAAAMVQGALPEACRLLDLGRHRLKDLAEAEQIFQLVSLDLPSEFPVLASLASIPNNLPLQSTPFIGRAAELAEVAGLLDRHRLVTLLGPGGLGKTRLSIQVGAEQLERYPDGVWFVELAPFRDPEHLSQTVANLFNLPGREGRTATEVVAGFLRHKRLLLILDNCEHLVAAAASFADTIIRACPGVGFLASSREALGINGEFVFRLPVLPVPENVQGMKAAEAMEYPAVQLFVMRASAALGTFVLSDADAASVAAICRRLDGIALAIELAAPRLKMLKPAQLLAKLDDRFRVLTGGSRAALPRQQTLRGLIDWSHDLLTEPERILLRRLSVFADGWTLDAATAVTAGEGIEDWEVFDLLASLVDKSLVVADAAGAEPRFRYLESARHYAAEKLADAGEGRFRARLGAWLVDFFKAGDARCETTATVDWMPIYGPELGNLRAALDWAFGPDGDSTIGLALTAYSFPLWRELGIEVERRLRAQIAVERLDPSTPPGIAARLYRQLGARPSLGIAATVPIFRQAVEAARLAGEPLLLASCLAFLVGAFSRDAARTEGEDLLNEALAVARPFGLTRVLARIYNNLGWIAGLRRDFAAARGHYERSIEVARAVGDAAASVIPLVNLAGLLADSLDFDAANRIGLEGLAAARAAGLRSMEMIATGNLGITFHHRGDHQESIAMAKEAVALALAVEEDSMVAYAALVLVLAALRGGAPASAVRLWGWVEASLAAQNYSVAVEDPILFGEISDGLTSALSELEKEKLMREGAAMTLDQAAALATSI
jgi:predicted ATPase/class 3 adenylate cyclase